MARETWSIEDEDCPASFYRWSAVITLLVSVGITVWLSVTGGFPYSLIIGYILLAFGMHIGHDCAAVSIFTGAWGKTIEMPGVIFELDVDGCLFYILYRFILAPLVGLLLGLFLGILGTLLSMLVAAVTFPFHSVRFVRSIIG